MIYILILLQTFTAGFELGLILRSSWFVNVTVIVLARLIKGYTRVHWRIVMLKAFVRIIRNPNDIKCLMGDSRFNLREAFI